MSLFPETDDPEVVLAAALERAIESHRAGAFDQIGAEYDVIECEVLPFWHVAK
ncbi:hypothetical protein [Methylomonas sp. UP202]|nr:hypothetical protein [Methylomonas sp. UP202]WGS84724.1 hypothetical protein QC632_16895 [Methylomonas sp. UP202]